MSQALHAAQWAEAIAFAFLGVLTFVDWARRRGRQRAYLAWAIGLLAVVTLAGRVQTDAGAQMNRVVSDVIGPMLLASGYALVLFRHSLIPVRKATRHLVLGVVVLVSVAIDVVPLSSDPTKPTLPEWIVVIAYILVWCGCIGEPVVRLWMASRHKPIVQRARLRALSLGLGGIVVVLLVAVGVGIGAGPSSSQNLVYQFVVELVVLGIVPILWVSFAPPRWLRRIWRDREELAFRKATSDLLLEEDPHLLADSALTWALRLTGADAGLIAAPGREPLASVNLDEATTQRLLSLDAQTEARIVAVDDGRDRDRVAILAALRAPTVSGVIAVIAGPFTPVFGAGELGRLDEYGISVGAALERVQLVKALGREINERQRIQEELARHTLDLERSNGALQEFAYVASHDLQEPLRMVASYLQLLRNRYAGNLDRDADEFINFAVDGARRMQALIDDLLAYSRVDTHVVTLTDVDLNQTMRMVITNLHAAIEEQHARITVDEDLPTVVGDPTQLGQLLQNLVGNAVKFHGANAPTVRVCAEQAGDNWKVTVSDNGIGIEARHAERIFMVFKRLHPMDKYPGTGIGLSICRKIVERHGGHIWVESELNHGAAFHFTIPNLHSGTAKPQGEDGEARVLAVASASQAS